MRKSVTCLTLVALLATTSMFLLSGCGKEQVEEAAPVIRPVKTMQIGGSVQFRSSEESSLTTNGNFAGVALWTGTLYAPLVSIDNTLDGVWVDDGSYFETWDARIENNGRFGVWAYSSRVSVMAIALRMSSLEYLVS